MSSNLKTKLRDLLPKQYQVQAKYWFGKLSGTLEAEMKLLALLVKPNERVIDVGGNRGVYAYQLWRLGARVEVFEPNPICFRILSEWSKEKSCIDLHCVALSSQTGNASLHIPVDAAGVEHDASASIENTGFTNARDELVAIRPLDSYGFTDVSFIKIDVEGHETSVINGATATLAASKPALLIEIEQRHNTEPIAQIFKRIEKFGYEGYFLDNEILTPLSQFNCEQHQSLAHFNQGAGKYINNFLFLHQDRVATGAYAPLLKRG